MGEESEAFATTAPLAPVTGQRKVRNDLEETLPKPYLARALVAPDTEHPNGSEGHDSRGMSVMQQHCAFFDQTGDGIVYPWETYAGFRDLGFNPISSVFWSIIINLAFSYVTLPSWLPSPLLPVYIETYTKPNMGSDSSTYDTERRFVPVNLENIFSKYALTVPNKMSLKELWNLTEGNRMAIDPFGWLANKVEWLLVYLLAKDEEGFVSKEAVRGVFDASLFEYCAKKNKEKKADSRKQD
uniref:RD20 n=1 Tax=Brassica juncea TaxID=3707 RepID=A9LLF1_BRAJU|nr:RD20 [Brassica juncea]